MNDGENSHEYASDFLLRFSVIFVTDSKVVFLMEMSERSSSCMRSHPSLPLAVSVKLCCQSVMINFLVR